MWLDVPPRLLSNKEELGLLNARITDQTGRCRRLIQELAHTAAWYGPTQLHELGGRPLVVRSFYGCLVNGSLR